LNLLLFSERYLTHVAFHLHLSTLPALLAVEEWKPKERYIPLHDFIQTSTSKTQTFVHQKSKPPLPPSPSHVPIAKPTITSETKMDMTPTEEKEFIKKNLFNDDHFPSDLPVLKENIGKSSSQLMEPRTYSSFHKATPLLSDYANNGCPVNCGPDWTLETILKLLRRGPHRSSKRRDAVRQLRTETKEKIACGYARVVRWGDIKNNIPKKLKISPVAMIPHKSKKYRCILDLSFTLFEDGMEYPSVNETTNRMAKPEAMAQLGNCLKRLVAIMADNYDINHPFMFCKLDIKDGFWRMRVSDEDAWNFVYVLPSLKNDINEDDIELVVPNSLQMGWCESPPFFCAGSETARDIIVQILNNPTLPTHRFEHIMLQDFLANKIPTSIGNITVFEVFVDDFVCATNHISETQLNKISRAMINGIHSIFPPPEVTNHPGGDPVSEKKLDKGEGVWNFDKEILGWNFNGKHFTIQLPPQKCDDIILQIKKLSNLKRASLNKYQKLSGKLQHASFGIPCGRALFSPIQHAMRFNPKFINLVPELKQILNDWKYMIQYMKKHPTSVLQLVQNYPDYIGHSDACALGAGGVWNSGMKPIQSPFLWQVEWPQDIRDSLVTASNPKGHITINDLELAGLLLNWLALELQPSLPLAFHHIGTYCDNTSAVAWTQKLRTSTSIIAGRLLRMLGMRIHARQASSLLPLHIAGEKNQMADIVSRAFKTGKFFLASASLVDYFNTHFPLSQKISWTECRIPKELTSRVISCLRGELLPMASLIRLPKIESNIGAIGADMPLSSTVTPSCLMKHPLTASTSSVASPHESAQEDLVEEIKSRFRPARMLSRPSTRPYNWLENRLPSTKRSKNII
jgi:hypothetical protein